MYIDVFGQVVRIPDGISHLDIFLLIKQKYMYIHVCTMFRHVCTGLPNPVQVVRILDAIS